MLTGLVFDIKEFTIHDGQGMRTTVFLKGCPLACQWCHNPEGQSRQPQVMRRPGALAGEGNGRLAGQAYSAAALADLLNRQAAILQAGEGGVTFSGGEPLLQAAFLAGVIDRLAGLHTLLDTSGYGQEEDFLLLLERVDMVYYDLKLIDPQTHRRFTGVDNALILSNLRALSGSRVPFVIRVPLVPGVTDTDENLAATARTVAGLPGLVRVDLLPYNRAAGAKYAAAGLEFRPEYDETRPVNANRRPFEAAGVEVRVA